MLRRALCLAACLSGCAGSESPAVGEADLPLGDVAIDALHADTSSWGSALTCKTIPDLPALASPKITISIEGLTLHLEDPASGYDKVFPIGPGAIDHAAGLTTAESLSMWPVLAYKTGDFALHPATSTACKIWWADPETGQLLPVFAGLPFMS